MKDMLVKFLYNNEYVCSFKCRNYGEMLKFLNYCKEYQVDL